MIRISRAFLIIKALQSLSAGWFFGTYVLFLLDHELTLLDANLLNAGFMTTNFLLDPFTGRLADRVGQKKVYVWGQVFFGFGMLFYGLGRTFPIFLLAEMVGAIGTALMSEALESWLRNNMSEKATHRILSRTSALASLATIPSAVLGSILGARLGFHWPWLMAALASVLTATTACTLLARLPESRLGSRGEESLLTIQHVIRQVWQSPPLRFTAVVTLFSAAAFQPLNMFWSPVFRQVSGSAWWLGIMWVGIALATAIGAYWADGAWKKFNAASIAIVLLATGLPLAVAPVVSGSLPLIAVFLMHEVGRGSLRPLLFTYSNRYIEDSNRSTTNSIRAAAQTLGGAIGLLASGFLTIVFSPLDIWGLSAIALILLALYAWRKKCQ